MCQKLTEDIELAIGNRSYAQVEATSGISKATLSRMVRQSSARSPSPGLLWKLSMGAQNNVTFELLMSDAGFAENDIRKYRANFEMTNGAENAEAEALLKNIVFTLLSLLSESGRSFTHVNRIIEGELSILQVSSSSNLIYVIDGMGSTESPERRICELIGRGIFTRKGSTAIISIVTTNPERYNLLKGIQEKTIDEVILVTPTGESIVERQVNHEE